MTKLLDSWCCVVDSGVEPPLGSCRIFAKVSTAGTARPIFKKPDRGGKGLVAEVPLVVLWNGLVQKIVRIEKLVELSYKI